MKYRTRLPKNYAIVSLAIVMIFLMSPMVSNPGDISQANSDSNLYLFDDMKLAASTEDFVDSSTSDIDSSPDIGTHSSFASQQAGPDSSFDTLTEANGAPPPTDSEDEPESEE